MTWNRERKARRNMLRRAIESYLYTTAWGKYFARPSQIRAAAKRMENGGLLPSVIARNLRKEAA